MVFQAPTHSSASGPRSLVLRKSSDLDEMRSLVAGVLCDHRLNLRNTRQELNGRLQVQSLADVNIVQIEYGAPVVIEPGVIDDFYLYRIVLAGTAQVEIDGRSYQADGGTATIINPSQRTRILPSQDCRSLLLRLGRRKMEQVLCEHMRYHMDKPLLFEPPVDMSKAGGARVWRFTQYLLDELSRSSLNPTVDSSLSMQLERVLMTHILQFIPNNYSMIWQRACPVIAPRHVRRAISYIETHFDQALTLRHIADEARVSVRTLAYGFQTFHGLTPMEYLRNTRLERAHEMLSAANANESVTSVAYKAGFRHLGRFSSLYNSRYGRMPSETLASGT